VLCRLTISQGNLSFVVVLSVNHKFHLGFPLAGTINLLSGFLAFFLEFLVDITHAPLYILKILDVLRPDRQELLEEVGHIVRLDVLTSQTFCVRK